MNKTPIHEYDEQGRHRILAPDGSDSGWTSPMSVAIIIWEGERYVAFADPYADLELINKVWKLVAP